MFSAILSLTVFFLVSISCTLVYMCTVYCFGGQWSFVVKLYLPTRCLSYLPSQGLPLLVYLTLGSCRTRTHVAAYLNIILLWDIMKLCHMIMVRSYVLIFRCSISYSLLTWQACCLSHAVCYFYYYPWPILFL